MGETLSIILQIIHQVNLLLFVSSPWFSGPNLAWDDYNWQGQAICPTPSAGLREILRLRKTAPHDLTGNCVIGIIH
jgi:hypothetical protein